MSRGLGVLRLKNFQKWAEFELDLSPPVLTLVGTNGAGKSTLHRALKWLALNRPGGEGFIKRGQKKCEVSLGRVARRRGSATNSYLVGEEEYKSFGLGKVPAPVADLLNLTPANFQGQHDAPFWLHLSPPQLSRELNAVVNLTLIDESLSRAAQGVRKCELEVKVGRERLKTAKARRDCLEWVAQAEEELKGVESLGGRVAALKEKADSLSGYTGALRESALATRHSAQATQTGLLLVEKGERVVELQARRDSIRKLLDRYEEAQWEKKDAEKSATKVASQLASVKECPLCLQPIKS